MPPTARCSRWVFMKAEAAHTCIDPDTVMEDAQVAGASQMSTVAGATQTMSNKFLEGMMNGLDSFMIGRGESVSPSSPGGATGRSKPQKTAFGPVRKKEEAATVGFVDEAMRASIRGFAEVVSSHFEEVRQKITQNTEAIHKLQMRNENLGKQVKELKEETARSIDDLKLRLCKHAPAPPGVGPAQSSSSAGSPGTAPTGAVCTPYELRTVARIGNSGWNTDPSIIRERAAAVFGEAGVEMNTWSGLCSTSAKPGSSAELVFRDPSALQMARLQVKSLQKVVEGDHVVWLDAKKDRSEMRPARLTHRAYEALQDLGAEKIGDKPFVKSIKGKFISLSGRRIGYCLHGEWRWTPEAIESFGKDILDLVTSYAEDT